ncbi:allatostatin-A receptor-like [Homalodisca vitripennis]|nr:allatostatin-A receptor-like [Homalodisca vitripennis]
MSGESVGEAVGYTQCINQTKGNQSDLFLTFCQPNVSGAIPDDMEPELRVMEQIVSIVVPVLFGIIIILGLFGNALVVIVVSANQQMRSTTNLLIINLAVADLCFIVFCVPFTATDYILPFWPFGDTWCKMVQYLIVVTAYASVYTLVLMSLDRFLAVVHPIASMSVRTERNAIMAIGITWIVILLTSIPVFLSHGEVTYYYSSTEHTACVFLERDPVNRPDGFNKPAFQVTFFATSYVIPLALICGLYLCMLMRLWRGVAPGGHCSAESRRGKKRVTRMVVVVVAIFAICWCPIQVILVLKSVDRYEITNTSVMVQIVSHVLAYMNSCVNPILYAFLSENFRKAFRKVIYCGPDRGHLPGHINGRPDQEKSALTKTTRTNDIL